MANELVETSTLRVLTEYGQRAALPVPLERARSVGDFAWDGPFQGTGVVCPRNDSRPV
jgi:hypothetical protein